MATSHCKHEEYSSNVIRVLHPIRPISPKIKEMDSNLDYLLEDLQSSVSPSNYFIGADVQYLSPANKTTVIRERSTSPGRGEKRVYSSASYQYSTSADSPLESAQNANQLDSLLQDLKTERDITRERDYSLASKMGVDPDVLEASSHINKTSRVYTTVTNGGKPSAQRELTFDNTDDNISVMSQQHANYVKKLETKNAKPYETTSEESSKAITLNTKSFPDELKDIPLSDDILPVPGTKVTTTVRTYTYEIPAETCSASSKTLLYKNESHNVANVIYPTRNVPPAIVIKTESYKTLDKPDGVPISSEIPTSTVKTVVQKRDVREATNNYPDKAHDYPCKTNPPTTDTNIIYKHDPGNKISQNIISPSNKYVELSTSPKIPRQDRLDHPSMELVGPATTYYYKHESSNTTNTTYGPPFKGKPPSDYRTRPGPIVDNAPDRPYPGSPAKKDHHPDYHQQPTVIRYEYSHSSTTNTEGIPSDKEPLLQPAPFPVEIMDHPTANSSPPRRLDDLMTSFNGNVNEKQNGFDESTSRRKEVETAVASPGEPRIPTKNIAGPPVYYPPGHEMFANKEESSAAYRAQGGYARASGRYEYQAESKSKSKTRSGAAVVPVCLPLCCAMPCSIM